MLNVLLKIAFKINLQSKKQNWKKKMGGKT